MANKTAKRRSKNGKDEEIQDENVLLAIRADLRSLHTGQEHVLAELKVLVDERDERDDDALTARVAKLERDVEELRRRSGGLDTKPVPVG